MSVLNIVELQNVVTSASGLNATAYLSNQIMNIQEMVNFEAKQINVNVISNFNTTPIQFVSPVNFSNVPVTSGGANLGSGTGQQISTVGTTSSLGILTVGGATNSLELAQASGTPFYITQAGAANFSGTVSANNFVTTSDGRRKTDIRPITNYTTILSSIQGVHFRWNNSGMYDIGVIAQDLQRALPEAVIEGPDGLQVAYMKLIPVLVEAVKELQERVRVLEIGALTELIL
jgi:hypothetical protein